MSASREEYKRKLMQRAEKMIDELLEWEANRPEPDLTQIEDEVLKLRQQLGEQMAEAIIEMQANTRLVEGPPCPECGTAMRYKAMKPKTVDSRAGNLKMERAYYHCQACQIGVFPPG